VSEIGIQDDFFEFGGDSLQAIQIISRIEAAFGLALEVRSIFESPSVKSLALVIDQQVTKRAEPRRTFVH
jgi:acyl carrier protein